MKKILSVMLFAALMICAGSYAEVLLEADFAGTAGTTIFVLTEPDAQLTVNTNVTLQRVFLPGGTGGSTNWTYSGDGQAAMNTDLYNAKVTGNPTRIDLDLGLAVAGKQYTITNIEVVVSATGPTDVMFDLQYTAEENPEPAEWFQSGNVVIPAGTTGTFTIDTTLMHLIANDSEATWNYNPALGGGLRMGFFEAITNNVDNLVIDSVTVNGIVEDYVPPVASTDTTWDFNTLGDTEGWTQYANEHISGLDVYPAFSGTEKVLSATAITGNDPQLFNWGLFAPESNYWYEAEIRVRQLTSGGTPLAWESSGCAVVIGETIFTTALGFDAVAEAGEWITTTIDITSLGSNEVESIRVDPVGQWEGTNKLFEVDYIKLTSTATAPEPELPDNTYWEFNTPGDLEGWYGTDGLGTLEIATAGGGGESVLTSQSVTGADPKLNGPSVSPGSQFWTTMEVRVRQLDTGGTPQPWAFSGCSVVINGQVLVALGNPAGWDVTTESGEWITASLDISQFASDNILNLRLDPVLDSTQNFEIDYIRLNKATTPPAPEASWEFNTLGDVEGWTSIGVTNLTVTNAVSGSEIVLTSEGLLGLDPQLNKGAIIGSGGYYWATAEMRVRHLDSGGTPIPFALAGTVMVLNGVVFQGSPPWAVFPEGSGEWVVCKIDISQFGNSSLNGLRMDPIGNDATKNFEVDYIRLNSSFLAPVKSLVQSWEFNTPGDTEGYTTTLHVDGLTVADAVSGSESVLTCADVTGIDPNVTLPYNAAVSPGDGAWTTLELRMRQLNGNPPSGAPQTWSGNGTLFFLNMGYAGSVNLGGIPGANATITTESNGWIVAEVDISSLGLTDLTNFRLDPVGNSADLNFEIDYIRAYANRAPTGYDAWATLYGLTGYHADKTSDPDLDLVDNLSEYAFGGNPTDDTDIGLLSEGTVVNVGSNVLEYVYYRRSDVDSGLTYSLEYRTDLIIGDWSDLTGYTEVGPGEFNDEMDAVTNHVPVDSAEAFIRAKAEL